MANWRGRKKLLPAGSEVANKRETEREQQTSSQKASMLYYEILAILSSILCAGMIGAFIMLMARMVHTERILLKYSSNHVTAAKNDLRNAQRELKTKVEEFEKITKTASEANNSLGNMLADIENKLVAVDERVSMLQGTATAGATQAWQTQKRKV